MYMRNWNSDIATINNIFCNLNWDNAVLSQVILMIHAKIKHAKL